MRAILLITFLLTLASCNGSGGGKTQALGGRSPGSADDDLPIRWADSALPLSIQISGDFSFAPADIDGAGRNPIEQMQKEWDDAVTGKVLFNYPAPAAASKGNDALSTYKDSVLGVYISDDWFSNISSSALAITQFYAYKMTGSRGEYYQLSHADIIVNERDYDFSYDPNSNTDYDMSTVILHELGHLLGLDHQSDGAVAAVMQPYLSIWESNRALFSDDASRISDNYTDSALSAGSASYLPSGIPDGTELHGVIELMASGECKHYHNGKLVKSHFSF
ncbi:hypothetical protein BMS_2021 [Halobacteriovorax marinus SJ]|uniref:Peptidase M10 metallopeptidase domain-containing protein n=1 Tax=Halobacteriovorax marinus (strain ATCC BAA-682 / DSM 15412 / SJ) TaxID=862908 RepID=E1X303_HALMS|nr:matrixin family metalloprotease [Halobacteriovorax marinus]CBW26833.1 hypothetical protein BMS_2021 [Halobacteriovorax marinus SJ]